MSKLKIATAGGCSVEMVPAQDEICFVETDFSLDRVVLTRMFHKLPRALAGLLFRMEILLSLAYE